MNTNRLVEIVARQRQGRVRDLAFAILLALVIVLQVTSLRAAGQTSRLPAPVARPVLVAPELVPATQAAHAAGTGTTGTEACEPTVTHPVC